MSVIGVISIKGGVGKTTTATNIGAALASSFNQRTLIVDANFSAPNLGLHLGLVNPRYTLHHVLNDEIPATKAIYSHPSGFHILPGSLNNIKVNPYLLRDKIQSLREYYDNIIIDSSPNLNDEILSTIVAADELLVVSSPDYPTLYTTMNAIKVAKQKHTPIIGLVLNRVRNKGYELTNKEIEDITGVPVLAALPEEIKASEALAYSTPVTLYAPRKRLSVQYKKLAGHLIGKKYRGLNL
ncbi:MAG: AAA family ATPase [Nanoarchaeota archaeon]|nr:AAA family ATPase [Nanoarchaeota archaeon]